MNPPTVTQQPHELTPQQRRTMKAIEGRKRHARLRREAAYAEALRASGWTCVQPTD